MSYSIIYVWEDLDAPESEQKFGDHFSEAKSLEDAFEETRKYIRGSLARQKHKLDEGRVVIHKLWDATEYAKLKNRFGKHKKIDDVIRPVIGHHIGADVHRIDADTLIVRVNQELIHHGQPLPVVGLAQWQYDQAIEVIDAIEKDKKVILAELCARFGKTIWSGVLAVETEFPITIVASYVLTSFASFTKDLSSFEQFRNLVLVDSADQDYQIRVKDAVKAGKQVVVFLSMCGSDQRQDRIDFLFGLKKKRLVFIDEADYGAHTKKQSDPFVEAKQKNDVVILMTGTNGERACGSWLIDHYIGTTYTELLMEKVAA
jgi:hypothetical protein